MKRRLAFSFLLVLLMIVLMRYQGAALVTPASPRGIIDLEFAKTGEKLRHMLLFLDPGAVRSNLFLDFAFIASYVFFLVTGCIYIRTKTGWIKTCGLFISLAITAGLFDVVENFLLLLVLNQRFDPWLLTVVYYSAAVKFVLAGTVIVFLLFSWPFALRGSRTSQ